MHTIPEQDLNISQKMTTLTFCQVIIILYTMSHAHKVVHASLSSISDQHSASFHNVIELHCRYIFLNKCLDYHIMSLKMLLIYFSQNGHFWNSVHAENGPTHRKMVVDCPLVITSKGKLFFRPDKTRKGEWVVQPVFLHSWHCVLLTFFLLTLGPMPPSGRRT